MFTGIIREIGEAIGFKKGGDISRLSVRSSVVYDDARIGDSVSVNGVCLTVTEKSMNILHFDVLLESLKRSGLGRLKANDKVNLEAALMPTDRLGGHFVSGHIDCTATIAERINLGDSVKMRFRVEEKWLKYVVPKGSVAVDGISLTVGEAGGDGFSVYLIPATLSSTNLDSKGIGDSVNIEFDILGKYVERLLENRKTHAQSRVSDGFLTEHGFM
ncbi:MAG: riboflavin synthase subunit alpha [Candidatus Omnitrophica bacterium CG1_02_49_10]|nr:MAG: riboflavin synthase subunit alpha [Candidatus Omnitrophica bacterium CG1_02_49_10]